MFTASYVMLWALALAQGLAIFALVRQFSELRARAESGSIADLERLPVGAKAPEFSATDARSGEQVRSESLRGRPVVLLFLSMDCGSCKVLATDLSSTSADLAGLFLYCRGPLDTCRRHLSLVPATATVLTEDRADVAAIFGFKRFPVAVRIDEHGRLNGIHYPVRAADCVEYLRTQWREQPALELMQAR